MSGEKRRRVDVGPTRSTSSTTSTSANTSSTSTAQPRPAAADRPPFDPFSRTVCGTGHLRLAKKVASTVAFSQQRDDGESLEFVSAVQRQVDLARHRVDMAVNGLLPKMLAATLHYLAPQNIKHPQVWKALDQCFQVDQMLGEMEKAQFTGYLRGIATVFQKVRQGLGSDFDLVMDYPIAKGMDERSTAGWVKLKDPKEGRAEPLYPIENILEGKNDAREAKRRGNIHLNLDLLAIHPDQIADEIIVQISSTIVHEATHKFAGTRDWLYAEPGKGGTVKEWLDEETKKALAEAQVENPDVAHIVPEMRAQNADSYALFATRMLELAVEEDALKD